MSNPNFIWDCIIVGGGPTALSAAVYTAREDIKTLIIEKGVLGGLAAITEKVDNYPGFSHGISGMKLASELEDQAKRFGAQIELDEVRSINKNSHQFEVQTISDIFYAKSVLIASGSEWKKLNIEGESEFYGRGIHNCATCDGAFYRDKKLVVIGGGNSAAQESLFLTKFASEIDVLIRSGQFKASAVLVDKIKSHPKIKIHFHTKPVAILGKQNIESVLVETDTGQRNISTDGVFVFIGLKPAVDFLEGIDIVLDENRFVITDEKYQTNIGGIFCAGDVRSGATMQIASAVGEGASAALSIRHYLEF